MQTILKHKAALATLIINCEQRFSLISVICLSHDSNTPSYPRFRWKGRPIDFIPGKVPYFSRPKTGMSFLPFHRICCNRLHFCETETKAPAAIAGDHRQALLREPTFAFRRKVNWGVIYQAISQHDGIRQHSTVNPRSVGMLSRACPAFLNRMHIINAKMKWFISWKSQKDPDNGRRSAETIRLPPNISVSNVIAIISLDFIEPFLL